MLFINTHYAKALAVAGLLATASPLFAQQYSLVPNDSIVDNAPFSDLTHYNITQTNHSGNKLVFSWKQIELSLPAGWTANLCDNGHCYTDFPQSGTMDTVYSGDFGLMSAGIDPGETTGTAIIRYALWEHHSPNHIDTLTWIITASNSTGLIEASSLKERIHLYPNPADGFVQLTVHTLYTFNITTITGQQMFEGTLQKGTNTINLQSLPAGNYTLTLYNNTQKITRQLTIPY